MPRRTQIETALVHLRTADPVMDQLISRIGPFALRLERDRFRMLVRSILSQQISTQAARSIRLRLEQVAAPEGITPERLGSLSDEQLRSAGLSPQKLAYIRDLCDRVATGRVRLARIGRLSDEEVIEELVQVKGIGRWTAQMFLMFCLGRLDVLPHDDLGIRSAMQRQYGLAELPKKDACLEIARHWRPYATVACWYCWRSADMAIRKPDGTWEFPG